MRRALGISVFSGMLGVTLFGIFLTPVFYHVQEKFALLFGTPVAPGAEPKERSGAAHPNGDGVAADSVATNGPTQAPKT